VQTALQFGVLVQTVFSGAKIASDIQLWPGENGQSAGALRWQLSKMVRWNLAL